MRKQIFVVENDKRGWEQDLQKQARELGEKHAAASRPMATKARDDEGEARVRARVEEHELALQLLLNKELEELAPVLTTEQSEVSTSQIAFEQRRVPEGSGQIWERAQVERRKPLGDAYFDRYRSEGHYNAFRHRHGIEKDPDHPEDRINYLSWLFLILAVETALNSVFWTQSLEGFVTAALIIAFVVSALNILLGFVAGIGFAYKNRCEPNLKAFGWASLVAGIAAGCIINYWIIQRRAEHTNAVGAGGGDRSIDDILSLVMFAVGEAFSLFAIYKGYRFLGSVPGYAAASKQYRAAVKRIEDLIAEIKDSVRKEKHEQEDIRRALLRKVHDAQTRVARLKGDVQNIRTQYMLSLDKEHLVLEQCVKAYRSTYRAVKPANASTPAWFDDPIERSVMKEEGLVSTESQLAAHETRLDQLARSIQDEFSRELAQLEQMATSYLGDRLTGFTTRTDQEGLQRYEEMVNNINPGNDPPLPTQ